MKMQTMFLTPFLLFVCACSLFDSSKKSSKIEQESEPTAFEQSEKADDRMITKQIRLSLLEDNDLSLIAMNIRIITNDGVVTLVGKVKNKGESEKIEKIVRTTKGVKSFLTVWK